MNVESDVWAAVVDPRTATGPYVASMRMTPLFTPYRRGKLGGGGSTSNYGRVPWETSSAGFGNAWWGDYSNGVTWLGKAFFGAWADARDLRFGARVYGASFGV